MFEATYERVLEYALRRVDRRDAEDVAAETYAIAWRKFADMPADPLPWLYAVAQRTLANSRRSLRRRMRLGQRLLAEVRSSPAVEPDPGQQVQEATLMRAALAALDESDRETLMFVAWDGLSHAQASEVLGITSDAFAVRLHRARRRLEEQINRLLGDDPEPTESPDG